MPEPYELSVSEAAAQIRQGNLSPVDLVESLLARIDALDGDLKAWVTIDREEVLETARKRAIAADWGGQLGPIHGVPVGLKDIFYTSGMLTACGSKVYADFVPEFDATSVAKIKEAGGIVLGKAVTTEFATSDPSPTRNPWNLEHTPGGSSSGSSAAVAARMVPAALGSQTGGSTCRPAAYNGIVGLKPTYGRISRYGVVPVSWSLDHVGILTRTVADAALMLQALSGEDENDPGSLRLPVPDFTAQMNESSANSPRIGLVRDYFEDYASPEMWAHTEQVAHQLSLAGAEVVEVSLPESFAHAHSMQRIVMNVECAAFHQANHRLRAADYGPRIRAGIEMGLIIPPATYLKALRLRREFRAAMNQTAQQADVLMMPATPTPAPKDLNTTGDAAFQSPWTAAGLPTVVVPSGLSDEGMPMAVQFAGPFAEEGRLLGAAHWCEQAIGLNEGPPGYP
ncbi:MAG: amidase [Chloroflexi bacterium]|nr:amidase [Chloroflexota bacterium]MYE40076.1 amidase [Chloroflexota bacterium]